MLNRYHLTRKSRSEMTSKLILLIFAASVWICYAEEADPPPVNATVVEADLTRPRVEPTFEEIEERRQKIEMLSRVHRLAFLMKKLKKEQDLKNQQKSTSTAAPTKLRRRRKKTRHMSLLKKVSWRRMFRIFWRWLKTSKKFQRVLGSRRGGRPSRRHRRRRNKKKGKTRNRKLLKETFQRLNDSNEE